jgi:hypothetical protein
VKRLLMTSVELFAGSFILYDGAVIFSYAAVSLGMNRPDTYPAFMADYVSGPHRTYEEAERAFPEFVEKFFPVGSVAKDAVDRATVGGFKATKYGTEATELIWNRHAGPCNEIYSIAISQDAYGKISRVTGRLRPACL